MTQEEKDLKLLVTDFGAYVDYVYSYINLPTITPLQSRLSHHMQTGPDRMIIMAARGTGKSYLGAIYTTWRLLRDPDEKILIVSAAAPKAIEIATFIRGLFERVPLLGHLKPNGTGRDSVLAFDMAGVDQSIAPSVAVAGISGQLTGRRATFILSDDVEVPSNSATETQREQLQQKITEYEALLIPDKPSKIMYLGTPQSLESIYNKLPYFTTILPAKVPEDPALYDGRLDPWILEQGKAGEPTDKIRFPEHILKQREAGMGKANFQLQYQLDTTLTDINRFPLKFNDLIVTSIDSMEAPMSITHTFSRDYEVEDVANLGFKGDRFHRPLRTNTEFSKYTKKIMSIDPAGSGTDEASWAVLGVLNGNVYLIDWGGMRDGYSDEALMNLALIAKKYGVNEVVPEKNFGSGMYTELLRKVLVQVHHCHIVDDLRVSGQKEIRIINNLEPIMTNHQLIINEDALRRELSWVEENPIENLQYSLMYQMSHLTRDRGSLVHDDRLDAVAIGLQYVSDMVIVNAEVVIKRLREKEEQDMLNAMIAGKLSEYMGADTPKVSGSFGSIIKQRNSLL